MFTNQKFTYKKTNVLNFRPCLFIFSIFLLFASCKQEIKNSLSGKNMYQIDTLVISDNKIEAYIQPYRDSLYIIMKKRIGINHHELRGYKPDSPLSSFVADIMLEKGREFLKKEINPTENYPSISIINIRGLRTSLSAGDVTISSVIKIIPFDNMLVALLINGEVMEKVFNHIAISNGDGIAGATCDLTPSGMKNIKINGKDLEKDKLYWVFVSDYIAEGGDKYFDLQNNLKKIIFAKKVHDLVVDYIVDMNNKNKEINYIYNARIRKINN